MKIWATLGFMFMVILNLCLLRVNLPWSIENNIKVLTIVTIVLIYTIYGVRKSVKLKVNPLNDVPNAFRLLLSLIGGSLINIPLSIHNAILGLALYTFSLLLNDEYIRKLYRKYFPRKGFTIALLGIDGSGKTTYAELISKIYEDKYKAKVKVISFSKYVFLERLHPKKSTYKTSFKPSDIWHYLYWSGGKIRRLIRLILSLIDNTILYLMTTMKIFRGYIIVFDRFMWSTCIKYQALGYPVNNFIKNLWFKLKPHYAIVLDIDPLTSYKRIISRKIHIPYTPSILNKERLEYLRLAKMYRYPVIDTTKPLSYTTRIIQRLAILIYEYYYRKQGKR